MNYKICLPMKLFMLFCFGGCAYTITELLFRGNSHWTMFILGGICFLLVGGINEKFDLSLPVQMAVSSLIITALEFLCGCIVNLWLDWKVWNYEQLPFNLLGQICLLFTVLWFFLSAVGIFTDDILRWKMFCEENPSTALPENAPSKPLTAYATNPNHYIAIPTIIVKGQHTLAQHHILAL